MVLQLRDGILEGADDLVNVTPLRIYNSQAHVSNAEILVYRQTDVSLVKRHTRIRKRPLMAVWSPPATTTPLLARRGNSSPADTPSGR